MASTEDLSISDGNWHLVELNPVGNTGNIDMEITPQITGDARYAYEDTPSIGHPFASYTVLIDSDIYVKYPEASTEEPKKFTVSRR